MNILARWLWLLLTCRLGFHAAPRTIELYDHMFWTECPRCHTAYYQHEGKDDRTHYTPRLWDVARGLYDREL